MYSFAHQSRGSLLHCVAEEKFASSYFKGEITELCGGAARSLPTETWATQLAPQQREK